MKYLILLMFLTGCGADESEKGEKTESGVAVQSERDTVGIKGEKGDQGPTGPVGPRGPKGDVGAAGRDGATIIEVPVPINQWYDPIAARSWVIGTAVLYADAECGTGWHLPTLDQLVAAKHHGLGLAAADLGAPSTAWTGEMSGNDDNRWYVDFDSVHQNDGDDAAYHGLFCTKGS
jgi:hypothetical protein